MADITKQDVIAFIEKMNVLELSELVKELEEKFGVSAAAPMAFAGPMPGAGGEAAPAAEEQTEFDVILASIGDKKIQVIKVVREIT
ncbi:MAG: 50S ribosomal protein L7/L12, partial [Myxococcales bacterium]|nr:50S ribosomal protein L7/L12 [Myxococcales bacterium]